MFAPDFELQVAGGGYDFNVVGRFPACRVEISSSLAISNQALVSIKNFSSRSGRDVHPWASDVLIASEAGNIMSASGELTWILPRSIT